MDDKDLMEGLLMSEKGVCDLYMHGTIESTPGHIKQAFMKALNEALVMQDAIYEKMAQKGWYPTKQVEQQDINEVKQKFAI